MGRYIKTKLTFLKRDPFSKNDRSHQAYSFLAPLPLSQRLDPETDEISTDYSVIIIILIKVERIRSGGQVFMLWI